MVSFYSKISKIDTSPRKEILGINIEAENKEEGEGESEMDESQYFKRKAHHSHAQSVIEPHLKHSHISNLQLDSAIQEKDFSINRLQYELHDKERDNRKWQKRFRKMKKMYKQKCLEFEESLAYLDIEGEQNKILENKTIELQNRVESEIKMIKAE